MVVGRRQARWLVVLVPAVLVLAGGWDHRWVADDAFVDFRVVHNLLAGHGPVFNVGERVEVYTSPLWVAILTVVYGIVRFVPLEWWAVVVGLSCSVIGVVLGGSAALRLGARRGARLVLPMGMLMVSSVAGVWDFATSGLETGLVFAWFGLSWWMLVRLLERRRRAPTTALVIGLGPLVRPDLALVSVALFGGLVCVVASRARADGAPVWRRVLAASAALSAIPVASELFRMAYFGLLVPNTALTKSAFTPWWGQGWSYLGDFSRPYWLWIPVVILVIVAVERTADWWRAGHRVDCVVMAAPVVGGLLDSFYVITIGGDFMHARMLLPGFFGLSLGLWIDPGNKVERSIPLVATLVWASVSFAALRDTIPLIGPSGIADERSFYVASARTRNPVTVEDYSRSNWERYGAVLRELARAANHSGAMLVVTSQPDGLPASASIPIPLRVPAHTPFGVALVAPAWGIGLTGVAAGPRVYIYDQYSLANPVSSHFVVAARRGRPGHEKVAPLTWMIARFGTTSARSASAPSEDRAVLDAEAALSCQPLSGYLKAISSPFGFDRALSDIAHSFGWTTMKFSSSPSHAERELCQPSTTSATGAPTS